MVVDAELKAVDDLVAMFKMMGTSNGNQQF
jgi:hypothetical protein